MPTYLTPGVYYHATDVSRRGITAIRTDIAAFVGLAERGPLDEPWPVESWRQFQSLFGDLMGNGYLAYCVKAFFENGGRRCYVVRVAGAGAMRASGEVPGRDGAPTLRILASSEGRWGNALQVRLAYSRPDATQTQGPQPDGGEASAVASIAGFSPGALVRLTQENVSGAVDHYRVVEAVEAAGRHLLWRRPLPVLPAAVPGFDLTQPIDLETVSIDLTVFQGGRLRALYEDLSIVPDSDRCLVDVINLKESERGQQNRPLPLIEVVDLHAAAPAPDWGGWLPDMGAMTATFSQGMLTLRCGADGLAGLTPEDFTGDDGAARRWGLRTLELEEEVALVAIPDILIHPAAPPRRDPRPRPQPDPCLEPPPPPPSTPPPAPCPDVDEQPPVFGENQVRQVQEALIRHCETMADRFALLDPPQAGQITVVDPGEVLNWRRHFDSSFAALYYPWVLAPDPLRLEGQVVRAIPPSGHVAGAIARTDLSAGVHRAPANVPLAWAEGLTVPINDRWQAVLNPAHVNCLRFLPGRDLRIYGARTVSSDSALRYVSVRRLLLMIEEGIRHAMQWAVFEPHDFYLRQTVSLAISAFLAALWRRGALVGEAPEEAFFVRCDEENNPPAAVDAGQLLVDVGVALVRPAEFIIFRIGRVDDELQITELDRVMA